MNIRIFSAMVMVLIFVGSSNGQEPHSDIEFGYEDGGIVFEYDGPTAIDAGGIFEADFEFFNMDGTVVAEDPGFASNFMKGDENFMVTNGDSFFLAAHQSQTLGSFLTYFNPLTQAFDLTSATLTIEDNSPGLTSDLVLSNFGQTGDGLQFLITADGSEIDTHVDFILSSGAATGAYGFLLELQSDNLSGDLLDARSELFWVVLNNGLSEADFEFAVGNFQVGAVPEPSSAIVLAIAACGLTRRRRG